MISCLSFTLSKVVNIFSIMFFLHIFMELNNDYINELFLNKDIFITKTRGDKIKKK